MNDTDWQDIRRGLAAPFDKSQEQRAQKTGGTFTYIGPRTAMDRLDQVVGVGNWSTKYTVVDVASACVYCELTIDGCTHGGFGYPNNPVGQTNSSGKRTDSREPLKEARSDALKLAAVEFGLARYLYPDAAQPDMHERPSNVDEQGEIHEAPVQGQNQPTQTPQSNGPKPATANQLATIIKLSGMLDKEVPANLETWGGGEASLLISELSAEYNAARGGAKRMQPA